MSCICRAGCSGGMFRAVKLWKSSSMSGPSAIEKPISPRDRDDLVEGLADRVQAAFGLGPCRQGDVDRLRRQLALQLGIAERRPCAPPSPPRPQSFTAFRAWPFSRRSSGESCPSVFIRPVIRPFLPSAETRSCSSASAESAASTAARSSSRSAFRSSIGNSPPLCNGAPPSSSYFAAAARASRAWPTSDSKAAGSLTASSARIFRSRSISALFRPFMNCE